MNEQNLRPFERGEPARSAGRKGGLESGKTRRRRKAMKEALSAMLSAPLTDDAAADLIPFDTEPHDADCMSAICAALIQKAMDGNVNAIALLATLTSDDPYVQARNADVRLRRTELKEKRREYDLTRADLQAQGNTDDDAAAAWLNAVIATHQGKNSAENDSV